MELPELALFYVLNLALYLLPVWNIMEKNVWEVSTMENKRSISTRKIVFTAIRRICSRSLDYRIMRDIVPRRGNTDPHLFGYGLYREGRERCLGRHGDSTGIARLLDLVASAKRK